MNTLLRGAFTGIYVAAMAALIVLATVVMLLTAYGTIRLVI